jgi:pyruvate-ferredoxin/flavodoxin oxidoreductase
MAVESRAYPLFRFDPDAGVTFSDCVSLEGNPELDAEWPTYSAWPTRTRRGPTRR